MPEEINRILTDRISDILFCPTQRAVRNLKEEGFGHLEAKVVLSGDVMQDAALYYKDKSDSVSTIISGNNLIPGEFVLATIHRAENTDQETKLREIVNGLNEISKTVKVIVPIHPRTAKILKDRKINVQFTVLPPVGYFDMIQLISNSCLVLTDSGGLQKEAYFFNKYCITFRDETEWVELVEKGYNQVVGACSEKIVSAFRNSFNKAFIKSEELYGGGKAAEMICDVILNG